jgi:hypothetical protein
MAKDPTKKPASTDKAKPTDVAQKKADKAKLLKAEKAREKLEADRKVEKKAQEQYVKKMNAWFKMLSDMKLTVNEANGRLRSAIKGILDENRLHKGAFADLRKIDNMSETQRHDYLASFYPRFIAKYDLEWEPGMRDLVQQMEAQSNPEAADEIEEPEISIEDDDEDDEGAVATNVVNMGQKQQLSDKAQAHIDAQRDTKAAEEAEEPPEVDEETAEFNAAVDENAADQSGTTAAE